MAKKAKMVKQYIAHIYALNTLIVFTIVAESFTITLYSNSDRDRTAARHYRKFLRDNRFAEGM